MGMCEYCGERPATVEVIDDDADIGVAMICRMCRVPPCVNDLTYRLYHFDDETYDLWCQGSPQPVVWTPCGGLRLWAGCPGGRSPSSEYAQRPPSAAATERSPSTE